MFVDEWRSHEDTAELLSLFSASVDETEPCETDDDAGSASSASEQLDNGDDDEDEVSFSSKNPFELLSDDN